MTNALITNGEKRINYEKQFVRLRSAMRSHFYLEAIFIEYAIIEDRTEAILRYEGNEIRKERPSIDLKLKKIKKIAENKSGIARRYFSDGLIDEIILWKDDRNKLIHALMKQTLSDEECIPYHLFKRIQ